MLCALCNQRPATRDRFCELCLRSNYQNRDRLYFRLGLETAVNIFSALGERAGKLKSIIDEYLENDKRYSTHKEGTQKPPEDMV